MYRSKSKGNLELPSNAASYRSFSILKAAEKANGLPVLPKPKIVLPEDDEEKSFLHNDSMLCSPGKDFSYGENEEIILATPRKSRECPAAVLEAMKTHYITVMKDLRKGFPAVCELVNCALGVVMKNLEKETVPDIFEGLCRFLVCQRFLVSCTDMRSRYGVVEVSNAEIDHTESENMEAESSVAVEGTSEDSDSEVRRKAALAKEKETKKLHAKRYRRFHFQIVIRIALYKVLHGRDMLDAAHRPKVLDMLRAEIADLMVARDRYDTWRFMESDIQFKCGTEPAVRELIGEVCGELLIPLPEYSPDKRPARKPAVLIRTNSKTGSAEQPSSLLSRLKGPLQTKRPFPSRQSSLGAQATNFGVRARFRQRSCLDYDIPTLQRSSSHTKLIPEPRNSQSLDIKPSQPSQSSEDGFQPIFRPTPYPASLEFDNVFKPSQASMGSRTPSRQSMPHPPSPRGTPYRERQAALSGLAPDSPSIRASAFLTSWSPFNKRADESTTLATSNDSLPASDLLKPRRQLMF